MASSTTSWLLSLPHEILHAICAEVDPFDLPSLCQSSRILNDYINSNGLLYKQLYLQLFDEPRSIVNDATFDWETELHMVMALKKVLESKSSESKACEHHEQFLESTSSIFRLLNQCPPVSSPSLNAEFLAKYFDDQRNVDAFLCCSSLFEAVGLSTQVKAQTNEARQLSAKLHCYFGIPIDPYGRRAKPSHRHARSQVYDLRNYTHDTFWGPFAADGSQRVDWEKMESIMIVLEYNLRRLNERSQGHSPARQVKAFSGVSPESWAPQTSSMLLRKQPVPSIIEQDPYNITGEWMRVVCFLDYSDLYNFNFSDTIPDDIRRPPLDTEEAIRLITMKVRVTAIEPPEEGDGQALPRVHFTGKSWSVHAGWDPNANSNIRGMVRLTPEGEVRWTTFSVFHGIERWRSEGIQIGGVNSDRGVLGSWFDKDFDPEGPAGPTSFWKKSNEVPDEVVYNRVNFPISDD